MFEEEITVSVAFVSWSEEVSFVCQVSSERRLQSEVVKKCPWSFQNCLIATKLKFAKLLPMRSYHLWNEVLSEWLCHCRCDTLKRSPCVISVQANKRICKRLLCWRCCSFAYETNVALHLQNGGEVRQSGCLWGRRSGVRSVEGWRRGRCSVHCVSSKDPWKMVVVLLCSYLDGKCVQFFKLSISLFIIDNRLQFWIQTIKLSGSVEVSTRRFYLYWLKGKYQSGG